jgi:hypothetical protein
MIFLKLFPKLSARAEGGKIVHNGFELWPPRQVLGFVDRDGIDICPSRLFAHVVSIVDVDVRSVRCQWFPTISPFFHDVSQMISHMISNYISILPWYFPNYFPNCSQYKQSYVFAAFPNQKRSLHRPALLRRRTQRRFSAEERTAAMLRMLAKSAPGTMESEPP